MLTAIITLALIVVFLYMVPLLSLLLVNSTDGESLYVAAVIFEKTTPFRQLCVVSCITLIVVEICNRIL